MASGPKPISIDPTQAWEGNDGPWSTFFLGVGTPLQYLQVLISLTSVQPWVVLPEGCISTDPADCSSHRGALFSPNKSSTWQNQGRYTLGFESNLDYNDAGDFGIDTLSLGLRGTALPTVEKQMIAGVVTKDFYLGVWGVGPRPTNLTTLENPYPSLMTSLREQKLVPSISYGYTAGARYQLRKAAGSLTLGGYDASRFSFTNLSIPFAGDVSRDLVVGVRDITATGFALTSNPVSLLPSPILSFIDAGVPHIWLPQAACDLIATAFNLTYNDALDLYLIGPTIRSQLLSQNISLTFNLAVDLTSTSTIEIVFPYAAFDLLLTPDYPGINTTTMYFPIRRAKNDTQYTLGRTFLQQAYLIADYERSNFSVHPCVFQEGVPPDLKTIIASTDGAPSTSHTSMPTAKKDMTAGAQAAIIIASAVSIFSIITGCVILYRIRRQRMRDKATRKKEPERPRSQDCRSTEAENFAEAIGEMQGDSHYRHHHHRGEIEGDQPSHVARALQDHDRSHAPPELQSHSSVRRPCELPGDLLQDRAELAAAELVAAELEAMNESRLTYM